MFYIVISLIIVILICTRQIFAKVYYPEFIIYKEDSVSAIKRLANNLNKYNLSAFIPNIYLIKKSLFKYYYLCVLSKKKNQYMPIDIFFYNNFYNINKIFYKYDFYKLSKVSHFKNRLRIIEISKTILAYDSFIDEKTLYEHLKIFSEKENFMFDELICLKEAVILSIFDNLSKIAQEIVLIKKSKNKPNYKDSAQAYYLAELTIKIENLIKSLYLIDNIKIEKFYTLSKIYQYLLLENNPQDSKNLAKVICLYSKKTKKDEISTYTNAKNLSKKINVSLNKIFSDYYFSLKNDKIIFSTKKLMITICSFIVMLISVFLGILPLVILDQITILQVTIISLSSLAIVYYIIKNSFLKNFINFTKKTNWIYFVSFISGVISIISSINLNNLFLAIYSSVMLLIVPVCYLGKKYQNVKIKFCSMFIRRKGWIDDFNEPFLEYNSKRFPHINILCGKNVFFAIDTYGRNYVYYNNSYIFGKFFDPFNTIGHFFKNGEKSFSFFPCYKKDENIEAILKKDGAIFKSSSGCLKISLLKSDDVILYELFSKETEIEFNLNLKNFNILEKTEKYVIYKFNNILLAFVFNNGVIVSENYNQIYIRLLSNKLSIFEIIDEDLYKLYEKINRSMNRNYISIQKKFNSIYVDDLSELIKNESDLNLYIYLCTILNYPIINENEKNICLKNIGIVENTIDIINIARVGDILNRAGQKNELFIFYKSIKIFEKIKNLKNIKLIKYDKNFIKTEQKLKYKIYTFLDEDNLKINFEEKEDFNICTTCEIKVFKNMIYDKYNFGNKTNEELDYNLKLKEIPNLASSKGGMILGDDTYYLNGENRFISSNVNLFVFCGSKNYVFKPSFLKNALNCNNLFLKNIANIDVGQFIIENGILHNGVCFYNRFHINSNGLKNKPLLIYFEKELSKNGMKSLFFKCTKVDDYTLIINLLDLKETVFLKTNFPFEVILNRYNVQGFTDKDLSYFKFKNTKLFFPCLIISYKGCFKLKTEQDFIIIYSNDKEKIFNFDFKKFDLLKSIEEKSNKIISSFIIDSRDFKLDIMFNEIILNNIKQYLDSHVDKHSIHGIIVQIDAICLKTYLSIDPDYVKEKILYLASYMFVEGDFLYNFQGFNGIREKDRKDIYAFIDLVNCYLSYTQNYEILYEKIPYITLTKYNFYSFTIFTETLIQHIIRSFDNIKNFASISDALNLFKVIDNMSCFFDNEYIVELNKYKQKCNDYLSKLSYTELSQSSDSLLFLEYILPNKNIDLLKRIDFESLSNIEVIQYYKLLSIYEKQNMYNYDNKINPLKTKQSFYSILEEALYYQIIQREYLGIKKDLYSIEHIGSSFDSSLKIKYKDLGKEISISFLNNQEKLNKTIIDKYEYLNKNKVFYSEVKEKIIFFE